MRIYGYFGKAIDSSFVIGVEQGLKEPRKIVS